jgi:hypothetical protein
MITLVCAACGKKATVDCPEPKFGVDLIEPAKSVGFKAVFNPRHSRLVIFCSDVCHKANVKKDGTLKKYIGAPKKVSEKASV